nr:hypothetical protein [Hymenobacter sp. BRD67]
MGAEQRVHSQVVQRRQLGQRKQRQPREIHPTPRLPAPASQPVVGRRQARYQQKQPGLKYHCHQTDVFMSQNG